MWEMKLLKAVSTCTPLRTFARTIAKGNGQRRVIVEGFAGRNFDPIEHFKLMDLRIAMNFRPVIGGFTGRFGLKQITARPNTGFLRFYSQTQRPNMTRHLVYDIQPPRIAIRGFNCTSTGPKIVGEIPKGPVTLPKAKEIYADERVVIQGFGGDAQKPVYKKMDLTNSTPRKVIKGFGG